MSASDKVFRDKVHGFVSIPRNDILPLVDTPEFQRLRRLTQLGTSSFTYPCAEHSRFQHSLGVCHLFRRLAAHFTELNAPLTDEQLLIGSCAALLHDIGHGPFSHALEGVLVPGKHHETWTEEVILSDETTINKRLSDIDSALPKKVADVIGKRSPDVILVNMISGQLDVDRMDYLLRDANCVGVPFGQFDVDRLIQMVIRNEHKLVVDHRGIMCVEEYLFARYHMYWQVYFHVTTRGYEQLLKAAWCRARKLFEMNSLSFDGVSPAVQACFKSGPAGVSLQHYLALDNYDMYVALKAWQACSDLILSDLCRRLLNRDLFKPVEIEGDKIWDKQERIIECVRAKELDPEYYLLKDRSSDIAYDYYAMEEGESAKPGIVIISKSGKLKEVSRMSEAIQAIARQPKVRVTLYVPAECRNDVVALLS